MSFPGQASQFDTQPSRRLWSESPLTIIPSWLASLLLHAALLFLFASGLKSCGDGSIHAPGEEFRTVGIHLKQPEPQQTHPEEAADESQTPESNAAKLEQPELVDAPPVESLLLPEPDVHRLGPGPANPSPAQPVMDEVVKPNRIARPPVVSGLAPGETSFFNIRDSGSRFVYVVDTSGSMSAHNAIQFAKAELISSLEALDDLQEFQVIFYDQTPRVMKLNSRATEGLYRATAVNRTLAREYIAGVQANLGTDHMPALLKALSLKPDVVFFLTDADVPKLRPGDFDEIRRRNTANVRIHCIEFGRGPELSVDNFLKKLARQNAGTYAYRDISQFVRR